VVKNAHGPFLDAIHVVDLKKGMPGRGSGEKNDVKPILL